MPEGAKPSVIEANPESRELREGDWIPLTTPGEVLREEFLEPMGITPYALAKAIGVPPPYVHKVLHGGGISPELGVLLDCYFGLSFGWWSRLQASYNTRLAQRKLADRIARIVPRPLMEVND
ncbi:MAG: HigA family addiction module antitoxin [Capsulimonadaceae bacterium]